VAGFALGFLTVPFAAEAQHTGSTRIIGYLGNADPKNNAAVEAPNYAL
jgi:hypothetical protein